ncbi:hypothetical protein Sipo8835_09435 [Streptomyces ipomoeae]|uniref:Uncharacterized protein n=1 Tax=Streptomyces ipomoeae TaxID=103232 RepID=A0AAE8W4L8_9ACTN|nr:hypothetical protein Sipo8835_09435 [Streptomyces ipomoeae]TQE38843.1 hypothetical protein Sipo7851_05400 [Streptomyces ipomoeae]
MVEMIHDLAACNAVVAVVTTDSLRRPAVAPKPAATTPPGMRLTRTVRPVPSAGQVPARVSLPSATTSRAQRVVHGPGRLRHPEAS